MKLHGPRRLDLDSAVMLTGVGRRLAVAAGLSAVLWLAVIGVLA